MSVISLLYSFGLFFAGIFCLTQYSAIFSDKKISPHSNRSSYLTFLQSFGISAVSGSPALIMYSVPSLCQAGIIDFQTALISSLGTIGCISYSFMALISNKTIIYLMLGIGGIMIFATRKNQNKRIKSFFFFLFSIGLILYGIDELKHAFSFITASDYIKGTLGKQHNFFIFVFGGIISLLMQSTSATAFMAAGLYGGKLFTHEQTVWFIYGGACLGSAIRSQLIAFSFNGSARRLSVLNAHKILLVSSLAVILYTTQTCTGIPMINQLLRSIYDNIVFEAYGSMFLVELVIISCIVILKSPIIKFYQFLYPDEPLEQLSRAIYLINIETKPKRDWISLMEAELGEIFFKFSRLLKECLSTKCISLIDNVCGTNATIIERMLDLHKKLFTTTNSSEFITEGIYEKLIILNRLNKSITMLLGTINKSEFMVSDKIVNAVIQHLYFVFSELYTFIKNSKTDTDIIDYVSKTVKDTRPRRDILEDEFIFSDRKYGNDLKLEFIGAYYDTLHYLREMGYCYKSTK